jgi:DNA repair exonuclease SbcCD ATPase subunit
MCCEKCKAQLERELEALQNNLKALQRCLDEEAQRRMILEKLVSQLKEQLELRDQELCMIRGEKDRMDAVMQDLQGEMNASVQDMQTLARERANFDLASSGKDQEIQRLKEALAKCCK